MKTKLAVYRVAVLPTLLHGCETWTTYRRHIKQLDQFHLRSLRRIWASPGKTECQTPRSSDKQRELPGIEALDKSRA